MADSQPVRPDFLKDDTAFQQAKNLVIFNLASLTGSLVGAYDTYSGGISKINIPVPQYGEQYWEEIAGRIVLRGCYVMGAGVYDREKEEADFARNVGQELLDIFATEEHVNHSVLNEALGDSRVQDQLNLFVSLLMETLQELKKSAQGKKNDDISSSLG